MGYKVYCLIFFFWGAKSSIFFVREGDEKRSHCNEDGSSHDSGFRSDISSSRCSLPNVTVRSRNFCLSLSRVLTVDYRLSYASDFFFNMKGQMIIVCCLTKILHFLIIYSSCYRNKSNIAKPGQNLASPPVTLKKIGLNQVRSKFLFHLLIFGLNMLLEYFIIFTKCFILLEYTSVQKNNTPSIILLTLLF